MLAVVCALLTGCASEGGETQTVGSRFGSLFEMEPVHGWDPPGWSDVSGVALSVLSDDAPDPGTQVSGTPVASQHGSGEALGLIGSHIRNDAIGISARFVELPMEHPFNERIEAIVWNTIRASGATFKPEVHPASAHLSDRGCVPGSLAWPAAAVLADPATGPVNEKGIAITCEVLGASGATLIVGVRVVMGDAAAEPAEISRDTTIRLYADVTAGTLSQDVQRWNDAAPDALWRDIANVLRRDAGGLSSATIVVPGDDQLALARRALEAARETDNGGLTLTIAPGITAPELHGLGLEPTSDPIEVRVDAAHAAAWMSAELESIHRYRDEPFAPLPDWSASRPVDCELVACIAITYDDGPTDLTPALLDTLREHRAPATFFMLGRAIAAFPETVARAARDGHELASHTMAHPDLTTLPLPEARDQVLDAAQAITDITGVPVTSYRPPYGAIDKKIIDKIDLPAILWSIDTNDWQDPGQKALLDRSVSAATPGDIILFHDTHPDTVEAAGAVITGLRDRGFEPVTLTELFDGALPEGRVSNR